METYIILHNIRSAENVGSVFRTADALGVKKIYLTGYTPGPLDRFNRPLGKITKTALGAEKNIPWVYEKDFEVLALKLTQEKISLVSVEQNKESLDYKKFKLTKPTAFVFGNEVEGLDKKTLSWCEKIIEVPMRGTKESLNVAVTVGVVLYRVLNI